jgi:hypothetical protein
MYGRPRSRRRTHLALERHRLVPAVISNGSGGSLYYFRSDQVSRLVAYRGSHRSCRAHQADERPLLPQCYARSRDDLAERRDQRSRSGHGACPIHGDGTHVEPPDWAESAVRCWLRSTAQIRSLCASPISGTKVSVGVRYHSCQAFGASGRGGRGRWPPATLRGDRCPAAAPPLRPARARRAEPEAAGQRGSEGKWPH